MANYMGMRAGFARVVMLATVAVLMSSELSRAQAPATVDLSVRLVGRPLYLRGFWMADKLDFDGTGKLLSKSAIGPVTLSGFEMESSSVSHKGLVLKGNRAILVASKNNPWRLQRTSASSVTRMTFATGLPGDPKEYRFRESMQITIQPDANGNFDDALKVIFADGLAELARSVPFHWKCYAASYFVDGEPAVDADKTVQSCVRPWGDKFVRKIGGAVKPPRLISQGENSYNAQASALKVTGNTLVNLVLTGKGIPVHLQIVRPLGAGLDEASLQSVSQYKFEPATENGAGVAVEMNVEVNWY
jgi:hypothetical protein